MSAGGRLGRPYAGGFACCPVEIWVVPGLCVDLDLASFVPSAQGMWWPNRPVESIPASEFRPPFCPRESCPTNRTGGVFRFNRHGVFIRKSDRRVVPRYLCKDCGKTCSQQTFSCTYYMKRPGLLAQVAAGLVGGSAHRQIARTFGCAPNTVTALAARLGRHALLLEVCCLQRIDRIDEPLVYDDFESFVFSQDHPFGMGTPVGQESWFVYGLECAPHRRGPRSSLKTAAVGPEHRHPGSYRRAFRRILNLVMPKIPQGRRLRLVTDGHPGYLAGLAGHEARARIRHERFPNPARGPKGSPRSEQALRRDREMFAVDLLHKLIRHSMAHHHRETIAFGRRLNAQLERGFLLAVWRNLVKARTERHPDPTTPAMMLNLTDNPWSWTRVLSQRLFPWRLPVPESWMKVYRREWITTAVGNNRRHALLNAF